MLLVLHVVIALTSVVFSSYLLFRPSKAKFSTSYALIAGTLATGTILAVAHPAQLLHVCVSGFVYVAIVSVITAFAQKSFKAQI